MQHAYAYACTAIHCVRLSLQKTSVNALRKTGTRCQNVEPVPERRTGARTYFNSTAFSSYSFGIMMEFGVLLP